MQSNFQLSLELSHVFPIREVVKSSYNTLLQFARDLQKSGSDIVVEEDLAAIFGRGRVNSVIVTKFKENILQNASFVSVYKDCEIGLDTRPGPTVSRALQDKDRGYLSTVIQLSMLGWMQDREALAIALAEGMATRYRMKLPDATPNPDIERISGTLAACSTQTSAFSWNEYRQSVEFRIRERQPFEAGTYPGEVAITPTTLLAAMDYLYLAQSLPEDRIITLSNQKGLVTLIVWAHHLLDLVVVVNGVTGGSLVFGVGSPSVIIQWIPNANFWLLADPEVCLLDKEMKVILKTEPDEFRSGMIEAYERHPLLGFGTTLLRRTFSVYTTAIKGNLLCQEAAQWAIAQALILSDKTRRLGSFGPMNDGSSRFVLHRWRLITSARMIFHDIDFDEEAVNTYISKSTTSQPLLPAIEPRSMRIWEEKLDAHGRSGQVLEMRELLRHLAGMILIFAFVSGVEHCAQLPLILDPRTAISKPFSSFKLYTSDQNLEMEEHDLLFAVARMLVGSKFEGEEQASDTTVFLISDFGWSVFLSAVGDVDPSAINPELLYIKQGVPVNASTGERRYRIRDSSDGNWEDMPSPEIVDRGTTYKPRSVLRVSNRVEYYGVRRDDFQLSIKFSGSEILDKSPSSTSPEEHRTFQMFRSYRNLHRGLWRIASAPPCEHPHDENMERKLDVETATVKGLEAPYQMTERVAICLVKHCSRSRWLAIANGGINKRANVEERSTMLRGNNCCEDCAVNAAASIKGKWFVII